MPSPVEPRASTPSMPLVAKKSRYGSNADSSSALPSFWSGVRAAAIVLALTASMLLPSRATASDLIDLNATNVTLAVNGTTALVTYQARGKARHVLAWGAVNALTPRPEHLAGAVPARLQRRAEHAGSCNVGALRPPLRSVRRSAARISGRRLQGGRWLVLGRAALATQSAASWLRTVDGLAARLGAASLTLGRAARSRRAVCGLGLRRCGSWDLRPPGLWREAGARVPYDLARCADQRLRPEPLHRHARLEVRAWLGARDVDRLPQPDRSILLLVLADS